MSVAGGLPRLFGDTAGSSGAQQDDFGDEIAKALNASSGQESSSDTDSDSSRDSFAAAPTAAAASAGASAAAKNLPAAADDAAAGASGQSSVSENAGAKDKKGKETTSSRSAAAEQCTDKVLVQQDEADKKTCKTAGVEGGVESIGTMAALSAEDKKAKGDGKTKGCAKDGASAKKSGGSKPQKSKTGASAKTKKAARKKKKGMRTSASSHKKWNADSSRGRDSDSDSESESESESEADSASDSEADSDSDSDCESTSVRNAEYGSDGEESSSSVSGFGFGDKSDEEIVLGGTSQRNKNKHTETDAEDVGEEEDSPSESEESDDQYDPMLLATESDPPGDAAGAHKADKLRRKGNADGESEADEEDDVHEEEEQEAQFTSESEDGSDSDGDDSGLALRFGSGSDSGSDDDSEPDNNSGSGSESDSDSESGVPAAAYDSSSRVEVQFNLDDSAEKAKKAHGRAAGKTGAKTKDTSKAKPARGASESTRASKKKKVSPTGASEAAPKTASKHGTGAAPKDQGGRNKAKTAAAPRRGPAEGTETKTTGATAAANTKQKRSRAKKKAPNCADVTKSVPEVCLLQPLIAVHKEGCTGAANLAKEVLELTFLDTTLAAQERRARDGNGKDDKSGFPWLGYAQPLTPAEFSIAQCDMRQATGNDCAMVHGACTIIGALDMLLGNSARVFFDNTWLPNGATKDTVERLSPTEAVAVFNKATEGMLSEGFNSDDEKGFVDFMGTPAVKLAVAPAGAAALADAIVRGHKQPCLGATLVSGATPESLVCAADAFSPFCFDVRNDSEVMKSLNADAYARLEDKEMKEGEMVELAATKSPLCDALAEKLATACADQHSDSADSPHDLDKTNSFIASLNLVLRVVDFLKTASFRRRRAEAQNATGRKASIAAVVACARIVKQVAPEAVKKAITLIKLHKTKLASGRAHKKDKHSGKAKSEPARKAKQAPAADSDHDSILGSSSDSDSEPVPPPASGADPAPAAPSAAGADAAPAAEKVHPDTRKRSSRDNDDRAEPSAALDIPRLKILRAAPAQTSARSLVNMAHKCIKSYSSSSTVSPAELYRLGWQLEMFFLRHKPRTTGATKNLFDKAYKGIVQMDNRPEITENTHDYRAAVMNGDVDEQGFKYLSTLGVLGMDAFAISLLSTTQLLPALRLAPGFVDEFANFEYATVAEIFAPSMPLNLLVRRVRFSGLTSGAALHLELATYLEERTRHALDGEYFQGAGDEDPRKLDEDAAGTRRRHFAVLITTWCYVLAVACGA